MARPTLGNLLDLETLLRTEPTDATARRDQPIGRDLADLSNRPTACALAWLERVNADTATTPGRRAQRINRAIGLVVSIAGFVIGLLTTAGLFSYQRGGRVNVLHLLAVFVGLQGLLLVLLVISMALPAGRRRAIFGPIHDLLRLISPGAIALSLSRWFGPRANRATHHTLQTLTDRLTTHASLYKWLAMGYSQMFALWFNIAAIVTAMAFIIFTDVAFGWSTTLDISADLVHRISLLIAWPWAAWLEGATPTAELVQTTRHFRAAPFAVDDPQRLGGWWPFVIMSLVVYGLGPRLISMTVVSLRLRRLIGRQFDRLSRLDLLPRLAGPGIHTDDDAQGQLDQAQPTQTPADLPPITGPTAIVIWAGARKPDAPLITERLSSPANPIVRTVEAGGKRNIADDHQAIKQVRQAAPAQVLVLVKAWDTAFGDICDFLVELRKALGPDTPLMITPLGLEADQPPARRDVTQWQRAMAPLRDPSLRVRPIRMEASR